MSLPSSQFVQPVDTGGGWRATYSATAADMTVAATATDIFQVIGSANKVIRVTRCQITADATSAGVIDFYAIKRTAANTGGTAVAVTGIAHDSQDIAYTATVQKYTANPAALGAGQFLRGDMYALPSSSTTGYPFFPLIWDFGTRNAKPIILRSVEDSFVINMNGQTIPAGFKCYIDIEWTEDDA